MIGMVTAAAAAVAAARGTTGCGSDAFGRQRLAGTGGKVVNAVVCVVVAIVVVVVVVVGALSLLTFKP